MTARKSMKLSLLAASALGVAAAASAHAAPAPQTIAPTEIAAPIAHAADEPAAKPAIVRNVGLAAAITAGLAAFVQVVGAGRILGWFRAAAPVAVKAARVAAEAPIAAAKAVGRAAASPLRFVLLTAALGVFALTGLNLFDIEWAGGLFAGGALVAVAWVASSRTRRLVAAVRRRKAGDQAP